MLAMIAKRYMQRRGCVGAGSDKAETKSKGVSTLYIQVEECLSGMCFHHSAGGGVGKLGSRTFSNDWRERERGRLALCASAKLEQC
jgi:hypothetical protein